MTVAASAAGFSERERFRAGLFRLADPKVTLASVAGLLLATCAASAAGPVEWGWLGLVAAGVFAVETAKNASGEIFDWDSGADQGVAPEDRTPFSGGKRVLVDGLLTRRQTAAIAVCGYALALAAGGLVVWRREPRVLAVGLAGLGAAWAYHAPPLRLSYRGFGELAVGLTYGPLLVAGSFLTLRRELTWTAVAVSLPLGLLIAAFLWINELPDAPSDARAGKRTLVVRLGRARAGRWLAAIFALAFALLAALPFLEVSRGVLLGAVALPAAWRAARTARSAGDDARRLVSGQVAALAAFLLYALGAGVGLLLS